MKKNVRAKGRAALAGPRQCESLRVEEGDEGAGQQCQASRSSGRRRSGTASTERGPIWALTKTAVIVGANVLFREGLARILAAAGFRIIASTPCADDHILSALRQEQSILFIIDLNDDFDAGLRQIAYFKQRYPAGRVVVLADQHQLSKMVSAFRAGANAYLVKVATCETFVKSLELVMLGVTLLPPEILHLISNRQARSSNETTAQVVEDGEAGNSDDFGADKIGGSDVERNKHRPGAVSGYVPRLSARQQAILRFLAEGDSNKTIAHKMAMAEATVKVHVKAILRKIRVRNRTQAAIWAMNSDPLILAKDGPPPASEDLPVEPFPNLNTGHVLSEGYRNGSTSLGRVKLNEPSDITMPGHLRLVRKRD